MHVCVLLCMQVGRGILDRFILPLFSNEKWSEFLCLKSLFVFSRFISD